MLAIRMPLIKVTRAYLFTFDEIFHSIINLKCNEEIIMILGLYDGFDERLVEFVISNTPRATVSKIISYIFACLSHVSKPKQ